MAQVGLISYGLPQGGEFDPTLFVNQGESVNGTLLLRIPLALMDQDRQSGFDWSLIQSWEIITFKWELS